MITFDVDGGLIIEGWFDVEGDGVYDYSEVINQELVDISFSLLYPSVGTYYPTVVAIDDEGQESSASVAITVKCVPQFFWLDLDGDGYGAPNNVIESCEQPLGYVGNDQDCDDSNSNINPQASEKWDR